MCLLLPADTRLRCSEVSRAWRALLADTSFFTSLDLSISNGLLRFSLPLLRAAAAKAGGQLRALDVAGQRLGELLREEAGDVIVLDEEDFGPSPLLLEIAAANAATLTELRAHTEEYSAEKACTLLNAAPALQLFEASVCTEDCQVARSMLRNEPPFLALRLRRLWVLGGLDAPKDVVAFSSDFRCHASIDQLVLYSAALGTTAAMVAVVDARISLRLPKLLLFECHVVPAALPQLTRLVSAGALRLLSVDNEGVEMFMFDEVHDSTRLFVAAIRASAMTRLQFGG